jgi:hypothetical protein
MAHLTWLKRQLFDFHFTLTTWRGWNDNGIPFHMEQCNGQISDLSIHRNRCWVVTTRNAQKELGNYNMGKEVLGTTRRSFRSTQVDAEDNIPRKKMLPISNIFKRYKITDITRSIKFGTMTNKVATRNPVEFGTGTTTCSKLLLDRTHSTRLYCFFKRRAQCIQDWCQRHNRTTWTTWGS